MWGQHEAIPCVFLVVRWFGLVFLSPGVNRGCDASDLFTFISLLVSGPKQQVDRGLRSIRVIWFGSPDKTSLTHGYLLLGFLLISSLGFLLIPDQLCANILEDCLCDFLSPGSLNHSRG